VVGRDLGARDGAVVAHLIVGAEPDRARTSIWLHNCTPAADTAVHPALAYDVLVGYSTSYACRRS